MSLPLVVRAVHEEAGDEREDNGVTPGPCLTTGDDISENASRWQLCPHPPPRPPPQPSASSSSSLVGARGGRCLLPQRSTHNRLTVVYNTLHFEGVVKACRGHDLALYHFTLIYY